MKAKHLMHAALLLVIGLTIGCSNPATSTPTALPPTATPKPTATPVPTPTPFGTVPVGFTADGAPYRGNPDAPVTLLEYGEFL
ncbi:MAG: hypothetical protein H5T63_01635 [Chloroflexi bacterium]|nr:hypothetical protein [Chloroflexota bacterium]